MSDEKFIITHNMNRFDALKCLENGKALVCPSIAVESDTAPGQLPCSQYGDIIAVFSASSINPENPDNKVYQANAYTGMPAYADGDTPSALLQKYKDSEGTFAGWFGSDIAISMATRRFYLESQIEDYMHFIATSRNEKEACESAYDAIVGRLKEKNSGSVEEAVCTAIRSANEASGDFLVKGYITGSQEDSAKRTIAKELKKGGVKAGKADVQAIFDFIQKVQESKVGEYMEAKPERVVPMGEATFLVPTENKELAEKLVRAGVKVVPYDRGTGITVSELASSEGLKLTEKEEILSSFKTFEADGSVKYDPSENALYKKDGNITDLYRGNGKQPEDGKWILINEGTKSVVATNVPSKETADKAVERVADAMLKTGGDIKYVVIPDNQTVMHAANENDFLKVLGMKGVQFDGGVPPKVLKEELNRTYQSLINMTKCLELDPSEASLEGKLGLRFVVSNANKSNAKYDAGLNTIYIANSVPAGSLAEEWMRALINSQQERPEELVKALRYNSDGSETQFFQDAKKIESSLGGSWTGDADLFARAGAAYIKDKLASFNTKDNYLCGNVDGRASKGDYSVSPEGNERKRINAKFDEYFVSLKQSNVMKSRKEPALKKHDIDTTKTFETKIFKNEHIQSGPEMS